MASLPAELLCVQSETTGFAVEVMPHQWQQRRGPCRSRSQQCCAGSSPTAHRICGAADRDAHISALEGGRVVDAVACHADVVAELAQGPPQ